MIDDAMIVHTTFGVAAQQGTKDTHKHWHWHWRRHFQLHGLDGGSWHKSYSDGSLSIVFVVQVRRFYIDKLLA